MGFRGPLSYRNGFQRTTMGLKGPRRVKRGVAWKSREMRQRGIAVNMFAPSET